MICDMWETFAAFQRRFSTLRAFSVDVGSICISSDAPSEIPYRLGKTTKDVYACVLKLAVVH